MTRHRALLLLVVVLVVAAGCGSSADTGPTSSTSSSMRATTTVPTDPRQQLDQAVRDAVQHDHRDAVRSLWTNRVPAHPVATGGPALAQLRRSVAARRHRGIRVRTLSQHFRIVSVEVDPSYTSATAVVVDDQRVQPSHRNRKPLGRSVVLHERVRLELRRIKHADRFVVWTVRGQR